MGCATGKAGIWTTIDFSYIPTYKGELNKGT